MFAERDRRKPLITDELLAPKKTWAAEDDYKKHFASPDSKLPISSQRRVEVEEIGLGHFSACVPFTIGPGQTRWALKVHLPVAEVTPRVVRNGETLFDLAQRTTASDKKEFEALRESPLEPFLVRSGFVIGHGLGGKPVQINLQPYIEGRKVGELTMDEIMSNPSLLYGLNVFIRRALKHFLKTGQMIEYCGFGVKHECSIWEKLSAYSIFASRNLIWNGERLFLIDSVSHRQSTGMSKLGLWFHHSSRHFPVLVRDYFVSRKALRKALLTIPEERAYNQYQEGLAGIVCRLEELKAKFGLDYRIVGGVAATAILGNTLSPFRENGSKRDVDVIILNPEAGGEKLEELRRWAEEKSIFNLFFSILSFNFCLEKGSPLVPQKQAGFIQREKGIFFYHGNQLLQAPKEAFKETRLAYKGIEFSSFPHWFHYFLYLTRNGGFIRVSDRLRVEQLRGISLACAEGQKFAPAARAFVARLNRKTVFINVLRLTINSWLGR